MIPVIEILRFQGTNGEALDKFNISRAEHYAIVYEADHLKIAEIEKVIHLIQPWMKSDAIMKIMGRSDEYIAECMKKQEELKQLLLDYFNDTPSPYGNMDWGQ